MTMAEPVDTPVGEVTTEYFRPGSVRHRAFVGPKFLYALFDPDDRFHPVSGAFMQFLREGELPFRRLLVNEHVVDEAATRLKKQASLRRATAFLDTLEESDVYVLEFVPDAAFDDALARFREWTDLDASLTDFLVAAHMREADVEHVLTYDSHYDAFDVTSLPYRD